MNRQPSATRTGRLAERFRRRRDARRTTRRFWAEQLETRQLMAADTGVAHNSILPPDVNRDGTVSPIDALLVINALNRATGSAAAAGRATSAAATASLDVNNDSVVSPVDALLVINRLNQAAAESTGPAIEVRLDVVNLASGEAVSTAAFAEGAPEQLALRAWVRDLANSPNGGVRKAYFDLTWDKVIFTAGGTTEFGPLFPDAHSGTVVGQSVDEIGATAGEDPTGEGEKLLFTIPFSTAGVGEINVDMNPAEGAGHVFELFGQVGVIDPANVDFLGTTLTIVAGHRPSGTADSYKATGGTTLNIASTIGLLQNDVDVDKDSLSAMLDVGPSHGTLTLNADGSFNYTPASGYLGADSFTYRASDGTLTSALTTVALNVVATNTAPTGSPDSYNTPEDQTLVVTATLGVLNNDSDGDEDPLAVAVDGLPSHGSLELRADGSLTYVPEANFFGEDSFTYIVTDGTVESGPINVTITISAVNDPPTTVGDSYTVVSGQSLITSLSNGLLVNDSDPESDPITALLADGPSHGQVQLNSNGTFTYTPNIGYTGPDSFTYFANDGQQSSAAQSVQIGVTAAPLMTITLRAVDAQRNPITSVPLDSSFLIQAIVDDQRPDFTTDGGVFSAFMDVLFNPALVAPNGDIVFSSTYPNQRTGAVTSLGVYDEVGAVDGLSPLGTEPKLLFELPFFAKTAGTALFESDPADGAISDTLLYNSDNPLTPDQIGFGNFSILITEGGRPIAQNDSYTLAEDTTLVVSAEDGVLKNDSDPEDDPLTAVLVTGPQHGTLNLAADGGFSYTPAENFNGTDTFTYRASDGKLTSEVATVTLTVTPVADKPTANPDSYAQPTPNTPLVVDAANGVLANDVNPDQAGGPLTAALNTEPTHGTVELAADGSFVYTPELDFVGIDRFTYRAINGDKESEPATVTITVGDLDAPSSITGSVYFDIDNDGVRDALEPGFGGVVVNLTGEDAFGTPVERTVVTGRDGRYSFVNLFRGTYTVEEGPVDQVVDGIDSGPPSADISNDRITLNLLPGVAVTDVNFGELGLMPQFITNALFLNTRQPHGVLSGISANGEQSWYCIDTGWENYREVVVGVSDDESTVFITAFDFQGRIFTGSENVHLTDIVRVLGDPETGYVVRLNGAATEFDLQQTGSEESFRVAAVDAAFDE
ncbi:MAG: Ig-like domain-containing protein [Pirellulales bacterium]